MIPYKTVYDSLQNIMKITHFIQKSTFSSFAVSSKLLQSAINFLTKLLNKKQKKNKINYSKMEYNQSSAQFYYWNICNVILGMRKQFLMN